VKQEIEVWLTEQKVMTDTEIESAAATYITTSKAMPKAVRGRIK
jgi:hypothetical protein